MFESLTAVGLANSSLDPVLLKEMNWRAAENIVLDSIKNYYAEQGNE